MFTKKCQIGSEKELKDSLDIAFNNVDVDKSQFLNKVQFEEVMRRLTFIMGADDCTQNQIDYLIERLDENGDGTVSKVQFERLVKILSKIAFPPQANPKVISKKKKTLN